MAPFVTVADGGALEGIGGAPAVAWRSFLRLWRRLWYGPPQFSEGWPNVSEQVFSDYFTLGRPIGDGCYGIVYECTDKTTGEKFAVKTLSKAKLRTQADVDLVRKEILIMHTLLGACVLWQPGAIARVCKKCH